MERDYEELARRLVDWIRERVDEPGCRGAVFGLSGGVDSATVAGLCKRAFPDNCLGLIMPCHSSPLDLEHASLAASQFDIPARVVTLDDIYERFLEAVGDVGAAETKEMAAANLKPRLRMVTLYFHANRLNYLVAGTGNKSEATVGYFTKYGDGGVDILPIGNLVKKEVYGLARHVGVPTSIIEKPPTAGLWAGQTDEVEMGLFYQDIDRYILTGEATKQVSERIKRMHALSEHKRRLPLVPEIKW
ncbi:MAG: NAD+ synthase [Actinobacteria bacterium]|nr:NAD+ synthase [Actinomycetota bacterium]